MATHPTPRGLAIELVRILVDDGSRPGAGTTVPALQSQFGDRRCAEDFRAAVEAALEAGFIQIVCGGSFVILIDAGFKAA